MNLILHVEGMTCQSCVRHVYEAATNIPGVQSVHVDLEKGRALLRIIEGEVQLPTLLKAMEAAGYPATVAAETAKDRKAPQNPLQGWARNVLIGGPITLLLMAAEWGWHLPIYPWFAWVSFFLVLPVQAFCGARFYRGAWQQLKVGKSNMDTLVALGSSTAFLFSLYGLLFPHRVHHTYFMEAAAILTLVSLGHLLEALTARKASQAIKKLFSLAPAKALRLAPNGAHELVPLAMLLPGDEIILRPGDRIPADSKVSQGHGIVDESMLTGEALPVEKSVGDRVYMGTIHTNGRLQCSVEATGEKTALSQIIAMVEHAQNSRADIQRLADRISHWFVPAVLATAFLVLLFWGWGLRLWESGLLNAIAVLIVACPCAMGLATPAALMGGTSIAAKRGILIRDGIALEKTSTINAIVFDKTGTLTLGRPQIARDPLYFADPKKVLSLVRALTESSLHPMSQTLAKYAKEVPAASLHTWEEHRGKGILAQNLEEQIRLGSLAWLAESGVDIDGKIKEALPFQDNKSSLLGLASNEKLLALFELSDPLRPEAEEVIAGLQARRLHVFLLSGDHPPVVQSLGNLLHLPPSHVFGGMLPEAKIEKIRSLQSEGYQVAFIGDGINDAPALTQADLGIAVSRASDIAKESADIILLHEGLHTLPEALEISHRTLVTIKQNLFWAFFYNGMAIPIAALGIASPVLCAAAMGLSDIFLLVNSLRLLAWKPRKVAE